MARDRRLSAADHRSDAQLLATSRHEPDAFLGVFDRHFDRIASYVARRAGPLEAEELTSEVFVRAFANRSRYDQRTGAALPWLYGIATNVLREHARREEHKLEAVVREGAEALVAAPHFAIDQGRLDLAPVVARALLDLSRDDREALLLHVWGDLEYRDVAEALEVPLGTVKSRINRARTRLRDELESAGFSSPSLPREEVTNG